MDTIALTIVVFIIVGLSGCMIALMVNIRSRHLDHALHHPSVTPANTEAAQEMTRAARETHSWVDDQLEMLRRGRQ